MQIRDKLIQYNFNKAANTYLQNKNIQTTAAQKIEDYISNNSISDTQTLDLGSGPGTFKDNPNTILYDLSLNMLKASKHKTKINGNATNLPFADKTFNVIVSNLMLQWILDKDVVFDEVHRTLDNKGIFIFTTILPESLCELTEAFSYIDDKLHTLDFMAANKYLELATQSGFKLIHQNIWFDTLLFNDIFSLLQHFKLTGTNIPKSNCSTGLGGRKNLAILAEVYHKISSRYPLSYKQLLLVLQK